MRKRNAVKKIAAVLASGMSHSEHAGYNCNGEAGRIDENRKSDCDSILRRFESYTFDLYRVADITVGTDGIMIIYSNNRFQYSVKKEKI